MGVALGGGRLSPTADQIATFADGADRLERQKSNGVPSLTLGGSLKLMWGVALGAGVPAVRSVRPDLASRLARQLETFVTQAQTSLRDRVIASLILSELLPERRDELARDLAHGVLGARSQNLDDGAALAALWAARRQWFGGLATATAESECQDLQKLLLPRLLLSEAAEDVLDALIADDLWSEIFRDLSAGWSLATDAVAVTLRTIDVFHDLARHLRDRKHGRPRFVIENEYDVQDLMYAQLKPHIPDLTCEEPTQKDAGSLKWIDFVSQAARLCIEAKMTRDKSHARGIANELRIDIESYYVHGACDRLLVFVYDPGGYMEDPGLQEAQLSGLRIIKGRSVDVLVRIRPR